MCTFCDFSFILCCSVSFSKIQDMDGYDLGLRYTISDLSMHTNCEIYAIPVVDSMQELDGAEKKGDMKDSCGDDPTSCSRLRIIDKVV